jgi:hypothetical protein
MATTKNLLLVLREGLGMDLATFKAHWTAKERTTRIEDGKEVNVIPLTEQDKADLKAWADAEDEAGTQVAA